MKLKQKKQIKSILEQIGLTQLSTDCFLEAVCICDRKKIHINDLILSTQIYPILEKKFKRSYYGIRSYLRRDINDIWKNNKKEITEVLQYNHKPTCKKLLTLLLLSIE